MRFILRLIISGFAIWVASLWINGIEVESDGSWQHTLFVVAVVALIFTVVNTLVKPLVKIISLPLYILTLGLFFLVVNALMLMLTSWLSGLVGVGLDVDGFGTAVLGALLIAVITLVLSLVIPGSRNSNGRR
ncbi:phage holin family protein [Pseudactinotalea sp. Z1739]|uniref:phage holin family protein n=1 Tax=Pseudactinotalea sp. Z1739 TaxID=3413028 RepID=UPI003C7979F6